MSCKARHPKPDGRAVASQARSVRAVSVGVKGGAHKISHFFFPAGLLDLTGFPADAFRISRTSS